MLPVEQKRKDIKILSDEDRQSLLDKLYEAEIKKVSDETGALVSKEWEIVSDMNFTINDTIVRGSPDIQWTAHWFGSFAEHWEGLRLADVRAKGLPFNFVLYDWSNVEKGLGMECKVCRHSLHNHSRQTCSWKKTRTQVGGLSKKDKKSFHEKASYVERAKIALEQVNTKIKLLEEELQQVKEQLKVNLEKFADLAVNSSYMALLAEQKNYLMLLKNNAQKRNNQSVINTLDEQLDVIRRMEENIKGVECK